MSCRWWFERQSWDRARYPISYSRSETTELDVLQTTLCQLLKDRYSERDIAVLFLKNDKIPSEDELSAKLNGLSWRPAKDNDSENIVISTVLKYSGLERPVVVLVNVHRPLYRRQTDSFIYGAVTRAMVKLVVIRCKEGWIYRLTKLLMDWTLCQKLYHSEEHSEEHWDCHWNIVVFGKE